MDDKKLDELIASALPPEPPDEVARGVTPWRRAMLQIVLGLALTMISLNYGLLYYALPLAGSILLLCAFRALRRENGWFRAAYIASAAAAAQIMLSICMYAVIEPYRPGWLMTALAWIRGVSTPAVPILLWRGLCSLRTAAGQPGRAPEALALVLWEAALYAFALSDVSGALAWLMLVLYIVLLWLLWRLTKSVEEDGYALRAAPVRLPNAALAVILVVATLLGAALGLAFGDKYPMDRHEKGPSGEAELRAELIELGFPEQVLADLTDEEVRSMEGAEYVMVKHDETPDGGYILDFQTLGMDSVAVRLPGNERTWRVVVHFNWRENPGFYGTEAFQAYVGESYIGSGSAATGPYLGRVLYDVDGGTLVSDYYDLSAGNITQTGIIFGSPEIPSVIGLFSFPDEGENQRGYIIYTQYEIEPDSVSHIYTQPHYDRVISPYAYPASEVLTPSPPVIGSHKDAYSFTFTNLPPWRLWDYEGELNEGVG